MASRAGETPGEALSAGRARPRPTGERSTATAAATTPLDGARVHRADVAERLVEAARQLMWEAGGPSFTVTHVVAAAGTSLKSFYRCFAGKDELLVALFADDARRGAAALAVEVDASATPEERLQRAVQGLFRFVSLDGRLPYAAALVREHLRLAESHPEQLRAVLHPFVELFEREVAGAQAQGTVRPGDAPRLARTLFHLVVSHLHALICHQIDDSPADVADDLWGFCAAALRP